MSSAWSDKRLRLNLLHCCTLLIFYDLSEPSKSIKLPTLGSIATKGANVFSYSAFSLLVIEKKRPNFTGAAKSAYHPQKYLDRQILRNKRWLSHFKTFNNTWEFLSLINRSLCCAWIKFTTLQPHWHVQTVLHTVLSVCMMTQACKSKKLPTHELNMPMATK